MKRGVIMSIHDDHAVVLTPDGRFMRAPLQGSPEVGEEIAFEDTPVAAPRLRRRFGVLRYAGAAAAVCVLLAFCLLYALGRAHPVVAYVTMDINPSVEIGIDEAKQVRALRALNDEAESIVQAIRYKGLGIEQVATAILAEAQSAHYLDSPFKDIVITSVIVNGTGKLGVDFETLLTDKLDAKLLEWLTEQGASPEKIHIATLFAPEELRLAADANGLSTGRMALYLIAKNEGHELALEQLKTQSIRSVAKPLGGLQSLVDGSEKEAAKQMLQDLLAEEQKSQDGGQPSAAPTEKPAGGAAVKPTGTAPKPTPNPTTQPSNRPVSNTPSKPTSKPASNSSTKPTSKPTSNSSSKPTSKPTKKPPKPSAKPTKKPGLPAMPHWLPDKDWRDASEHWNGRGKDRRDDNHKHDHKKDNNKKDNKKDNDKKDNNKKDHNKKQQDNKKEHNQKNEHKNGGSSKKDSNKNDNNRKDHNKNDNNRKDHNKNDNSNNNKKQDGGKSGGGNGKNDGGKGGSGGGSNKSG